MCDALDRDGSLLDVGCANGLPMESVRAWAAERGRAIEPFGLDIAPELAALARRRLPRWRERVWVGNALDWRPPRRFTFTEEPDGGDILALAALGFRAPGITERPHADPRLVRRVAWVDQPRPGAS